jgi:hypothetical protein
MFLLPHLAPRPLPRIDPKHEIFQINAHRLPGSNMILLDRVEEGAQARQPHAPKDWHLAYHEATTARIFKGSDRTPGCIRIIKYDWAGLGMVVRFDVDAFVPDEDDEVLLEEDEHTQEDSIWDELGSLIADCGISDCTTVDSDDWVSIDSTLAEAGSVKPGMPTSLSETTIQPTSTGIDIMRHPYNSPPHENLIAIKVRNECYRSTSGDGVKSMNRAHDVYAQLLFARLPMLYLAKHNDGDFKPGVTKIATEGEEWAEVRGNVDKTLRGVRRVLGWMMNVVDKCGEGVRFEGRGKEIVALEAEKGGILGLSEETLSKCHLAGSK